MNVLTIQRPARHRIFLSPPHMSAAEYAFIEEAFRSNYIAPVGPHVDAFEREFCARFGFRHAAAVSSGTAAIHLALRLLGVQPGEEVVCSTLTFTASANPIVYEQARPVFIDSDEATWNMDPVLLEEWLAARAKAGRLPRAVIAVDLYGQCANLDRIAAACERYDVPLIEDAAEALGATLAGRPAGTFGRMGIFSFNGNKIITTSGGGMLVSENNELINQARFLATQARDPAQHYQHSQLGFNYRLSNVLAGIGRAQLQVIGERVDARRRVFAHYAAALQDLPGVAFMPEAAGSRGNRWLTCLTIDPAKAGVDSEQVRRALEAENIEARPVWKPLHLQPVFAGCEVVGGAVSDRLFNQGLCLPSGSAMTEDDLEQVIGVVRSVFPRQPSSPGRSPSPTSIASSQPESPLLSIIGMFVRERFTNTMRTLLGWCDRHIGKHSATRFAAILLIYTLELGTAFYLAYQLRWDFAVPGNYQQQLLALIIPVTLCKLLLLYSFGQFRSIISYFSLADLGGVVLSMSTVSAFMLGLWYLSSVTAAPSRAETLMDFVLSVALISGSRLSLRVARMWSISGQKRPGLVERRVAIIGAGDVGQALAKDLLRRGGCGLRPIFFVDDDLEKIGRNIHGLPVYGPIEKLVKLAPGIRVHELVITLTGATPKRVKDIVELGRQIGATTQIIPSFTQLATGEVKVDRFRPVAIEDLLGREQVDLDSKGIARLLHDRVVLVTGAGGSIGSELCRQILEHEPRQLVMVEQTEIALFEIEQELIETKPGERLHPIIVDVTDEPAIRAVFAQYRPAIVFHAAAHKHVPLMERQPREALKNNALATASLTRLASEYGVERFVFISTDKAINPTSVMGCSKRLAEKTLLAQQHAPGNRTAFLAVRFGNVLGSSGSVIPTFKRQIAQGGPVTVTHREMTRYFMTIHEAVGLVLQTATLGCGGEIFILDMGQPVKIIDMARQMIELSGYKPDVDIEIKVTGLRPGEKLFEELRHTDESHEPTEHPQIFKLRSEPGPEDTETWLCDLRAAAAAGTPQASKQAMKRLVPEYTPFTE
ncbi:MAG TPA: SDR family NAD(P)-dependent oxidoreductase [Opitutaceae bacterium]|jgi:FlaA1/EpsC-like NDP-sugar epimerase/dTDP-4-amino-4,6-dideoxygalactose transaminase|nr:SDR family NAD(P)-dependent oxidoreductase [Opitutaceae bacterium]